ncbi:hypothetical protein MHYP_G00318120 [Metynnis hypsauchen]
MSSLEQISHPLGTTSPLKPVRSTGVEMATLKKETEIWPAYHFTLHWYSRGVDRPVGNANIVQAAANGISDCSSPDWPVLNSQCGRQPSASGCIDATGSALILCSGLTPLRLPPLVQHRFLMQNGSSKAAAEQPPCSSVVQFWLTASLPCQGEFQCCLNKVLPLLCSGALKGVRERVERRCSPSLMISLAICLFVKPPSTLLVWNGPLLDEGKKQSGSFSPLIREALENSSGSQMSAV